MSYPPPPPADGAPDPYQTPPPPPADPTLHYPPPYTPPTSPAPTSGSGYGQPTSGPGYGQPTSGSGYPPPGQPTSGSGYPPPPGGYPPPPGYGQPQGYPPPPGYGAPGTDKNPFGGPAQYGQPAYGSPYGPQVMPTNTMAILALVFAFIFSPAAVVLGHIAKKQISQTGEQGSGLATAGLILGYIGTVIIVLYCAFFVAAIAFGIGTGGTTTSY
ncbi:DUF4190 domain-containing protein [Actinoplanes couchii]|uniref:DUF4190 domain-containing protein n=1 Tax=Actinoplanes couchii TaxID=403638 RepID=A0ABQ3XA16_9ACTN|nr:DUF4190 domain-containing protein [Actinoplanes couchii]MDR6325044.1 hypothetical protein [Actinoplanes couchii]GID55334.1 hypothetical protein Aco03nite_037380 [Actinoplanes couchii]